MTKPSVLPARKAMEVMVTLFVKKDIFMVYKYRAFHNNCVNALNISALVIGPITFL